MKKVFCVLLLVCAGASMIFAQQKAAEAEEAAPAEKANAVSVLDTIPLFKGFIASDSDADTFFFDLSFAYERLIAPHWSIGPEVDMYFGQVGDDIPYFYLSMAGAARYYPMSEKMEKFFFGAVLGFNVQAVDGETDTKDGGFVGPVIGLRAGYRLMLGKMFFVEPSMAYIYAKSGISFSFGGGNDDFGLDDIGAFSFSIPTPTPNGWEGGLRIGLTF